mgnify:CR=1 FL=1
MGQLIGRLLLAVRRAVMNFANDPAGWAQVTLAGIAIVLAVVFYWCEYRRDKQKAEGERKKEQERKRKLKKAILSALKQELEMNWRLLHNPPLLQPKVYHPRYYDPTCQIFKYPDDAIGLALSRVESDVLLDPGLAQGLLAVRQAVRFVNQQVDELMAFRFGSPDTLAKASDFFRNDPNCIVKFASDANKIPKRLRPWFQELALRHWAIVNEGYWYRLRPGLMSVRPYVDAALQEVGLHPLKMTVPEESISTTIQGVISSGSPGTVSEVGEAPLLSAWTGIESSGSTVRRQSSQGFFIQETGQPSNETSDSDPPDTD